MEKYKDKVILIGLTFLDKEGNLIEQYQTHGIIEEITKRSIIRVKRDDGSIFQVPFEEEAIQTAKPGEYRERSTGTIIRDPDYITSWSVTKTASSETMESYKKEGFKIDLD
jgi:hypothetical protein